jgi:hypothetical protein
MFLAINIKFKGYCGCTKCSIENTMTAIKLVREVVFSVKVCHHLSCLLFQVFDLSSYSLSSIFVLKLLSIPSPNSKLNIGEHKQVVHPSLINLSKGAGLTASEIKRGQISCSSCFLTVFCRSKFCLAKTILFFCVFNCDPGGLWESFF